jgi:hypothetical protein
MTPWSETMKQKDDPRYPDRHRARHRFWWTPYSLIGTSTIVKPHIPRDHDLLTPAQIAKVLAIGGGFNPPPPRS